MFSNKIFIDAGIGNWTLTTAKGVFSKNPSPFLPYQIPSLQEDSTRPLEDTPDPHEMLSFQESGMEFSFENQSPLCRQDGNPGKGPDHEISEVKWMSRGDLATVR